MWDRAGFRPGGYVKLESKVGVNRLLNWPHGAKTRSKLRGGGNGRVESAVNKEISNPFKLFKFLYKVGKRVLVKKKDT